MNLFAVIKMYIIYGRNNCPYTQKAVKFATDNELDFTYIQVKTCNNIPEPFKQQITSANHRTVPCVFRVEFIGGFTEFMDYFSGEESNSDVSGSE